MAGTGKYRQLSVVFWYPLGSETENDFPVTSSGHFTCQVVMSALSCELDDSTSVHETSTAKHEAT